MKTTTLSLKHSMNRTSYRLALLLIPLVLACFALSPQARATCQDACLTNNNTVQGDDALSKNSGTDNTAIGFHVLRDNTAGSDNTATGALALVLNTTGYGNTANGDSALTVNTTGGSNTAIGAFALLYNQTGDNNTATGFAALQSNLTGVQNTAIGAFALGGEFANGSNNIGVGFAAGSNLLFSSDNIEIGNLGVLGDSGIIRIGTQGTQTATFIAGIRGVPISGGTEVGVNSSGQLGVRASSARYKEAIKPMDKASEAILALKPVTFRYKHDLDPKGIPQFGLVAEEVEKVNPDLVARDDEGKPYTVRYEAVNAMLLNEFLKEHRKVQELEANAARQQKQIEGLAARLQKVSDQLELSKAAPQTVLNNR
jgi:Chaperone of endosialidase